MTHPQQTTREVIEQLVEALDHCMSAITERGLNGSPDQAEKWGLQLPLVRAESAITAAQSMLANLTPSTTGEALVKLIPTAEELGAPAPNIVSKPLTYFQVAKAFLSRKQPEQRVDIFRSGVRFAEKHHGITGTASQARRGEAEPASDWKTNTKSIA